MLGIIYQTLMSEICKNCGTEIVMNFCGNCGQKKAKRIDRTYIKDEIQYTVLHMNKGFFYSIKKILRAPGKTAREFLEGNRVNHYKPILLVFVVAGISAFLTNFFIPHPEEIIEKYYQIHPKLRPPFDVKSFYIFMFKYHAFIMLLSVPFIAFFTWISFRKWGYNYYENIVINAFCLIYFQALTIIFVFPLQLLWKDNPEMFMSIPMILFTLITVISFPLFFINLYDKKSAGEVILRLFLFGIIICVSSLVLCLLAGFFLGMYLAKNNIDPNVFFGIKPI